MAGKRAVGRVQRVAGELWGLVRNLTRAEVSEGLANTIEIIRSGDFDRSVKKLFGRKEHRELFDHAIDCALCGDPEQGGVIAGTGTCRKVRIGRPDQERGDRGGARVIYYYSSEFRCAYLLLAYAKNEADDLSEDGKKWLRQVAYEFEEYLSSRGVE